MVITPEIRSAVTAAIIRATESEIASKRTPVAETQAEVKTNLSRQADPPGPTALNDHSL